ncbi:MOSC domain-containing protein YiiM [Kribbella voronezhensis]|uniref:MOSC domain-containing protein YiiM n=1 Tax=Kribbella voronezhensis TaxID=2512212 RepID=A0A4R7SYN6_9ACTN|nr:MOSC domain-containing protein [Kribbella voronezhensis]TDU84444.1 MOSC domain-containing protein YiiM [Kribbella voronezhensis]
MGKGDQGRLYAVNVVHEIRPGAGRQTAIDKRPATGRIEVGTLGLSGDTQCDRRYHGGPDKALYAYATEDAAWWAKRLDRDIPPGLFGENLTTEGIDCTHALLGERWRLGADVVVEVRMPRSPCDNLSLRMGIPAFHKEFSASRRVGAYLAVLTTGSVAAGDLVTIEHRPTHEVTVANWVGRRNPEHARRLLDSGEDLAPDVRRTALRLVRKRS